MQNIEPFYGWEELYQSVNDERSPLFQAEYNLQQYENTIYNYYIHPLWDYIGSSTLYLKILYVDYTQGFAIIELFGEWNDALHNDIMHLKRNIVDYLLSENIQRFILITENVLNFHASDDAYYEEWFEEVEDGWIVTINTREHVYYEWTKHHLDYYLIYGGELDELAWRTLKPKQLYQVVAQIVQHRLL